MKTLVFLSLILAMATGAFAQTMQLKNGKVMPAKNFVRNGDLIMAEVVTPMGGKGQVGFQVADVASFDLPEPDGLVTADQKMQNGDYAGALSAVESVVSFQETIRDIPGNWWAQAALIKVSSLLELGRMADAVALTNEITRFSKDPQILVSAQLEIALSSKFKTPEEALAAFNSAIDRSVDPRTLSEAWIAEGDLYSGQHEFDEALLAYLNVTVFYPDNNPLLPRAIWGAGQAYSKLKDKLDALKSFRTLVTTYPNSPEAKLAQTEIAKKTNLP